MSPIPWQGAFDSGEAVCIRRSGTRPDGGRTRERFSAIEEDTFTWQAERSEDGGATWEVYWTLAYTRNPSGGSPPAGPDDATGCATAEYRAFDFWEGNWSAGGSATNNLVSRLGGCILEENWSSAEDGTSFNMYDARSGMWNQVWTDTNDNTLIIYGGLDGDRMVMIGPRLGVTERIAWTPNADGTVRQLSENSSTEARRGRRRTTLPTWSDSRAVLPVESTSCRCVETATLVRNFNRLDSRQRQSVTLRIIRKGSVSGGAP